VSRIAWILLLGLAGVAAGAAVAWQQGLWRVPDRHNPWAPLSLSEPPSWSTRFKLSRLVRDAALCRSALAQAPWQTRPVPDRRTGEGCGFENAIHVERMQVRLNAPFTLSCPAAVSLALWEQHVLLPSAAGHLGSRPVQLEHFGTYACRNLYGRKTGARSRHATADAIDFAGVLLGDGRRITIARHWDAAGPEGVFLRRVHRGACRFFDAALGPDYNAAHADHLHLDRGRHRACR
jgi:hypothetical protein